MAIGTVKWFNATKGYGFIQPDDGSKDVFLHISDVQRSGLQDVREGDQAAVRRAAGPAGQVLGLQPEDGLTIRTEPRRRLVHDLSPEWIHEEFSDAGPNQG